MSARRRSSVHLRTQPRTWQAGNEGDSDPDTYGTRALHSFLKRYRRVNIAEACEKSKINFDLKKLVVWANSTGRWERVATPDPWRNEHRKEHRSICRAVVTKVFGLSAEQYEAMRDIFDDDQSTDLMGIYQHHDEPDRYAIVLRLPHRDKHKGLKTGLELTGATATGAILGLLAPSAVGLVRNREKEKWFDAFQKYVFNALYLRERLSSNGHNETYRSLKLPSPDVEKNLDVFVHNGVDSMVRAVFDWEQDQYLTNHKIDLRQKIQSLTASEFYQDLLFLANAIIQWEPINNEESGPGIVNEVVGPQSLNRGFAGISNFLFPSSPTDSLQNNETRAAIIKAAQAMVLQHAIMEQNKKWMESKPELRGS